MSDWLEHDDAPIARPASGLQGSGVATASGWTRAACFFCVQGRSSTCDRSDQVPENGELRGQLRHDGSDPLCLATACRDFRSRHERHSTPHWI
jgi:hypothetical protein